MDKFRQFAELSSAAFIIVAAVLIGLWIGLWLDSKTGIPGLFTIVMIALGLAGGVANLLKILNRINEGK